MALRQRVIGHLLSPIQRWNAYLAIGLFGFGGFYVQSRFDEERQDRGYDSCISRNTANGIRRESRQDEIRATVDVLHMVGADEQVVETYRRELTAVIPEAPVEDNDCNENGVLDDGDYERSPSTIPEEGDR